MADPAFEYGLKEKRMRYLRNFGLAAAVVGIAMAFAAGASATTITSPTGTAYTGEIHMTSEGHLVLNNPIAKIECHATLKSATLTHGSGQTAKAAITVPLWGTSGNLHGECTNSWHVTNVNAGTLEIHWKAEHEGTVTSSGAKIRSERFGIICVYETNNTDVGTLTDSHKTGTTASPSTATWHVNGELLRGAESSPLCGMGSTKWEGSYKIETPDQLYIDP